MKPEDNGLKLLTQQEIEALVEDMNHSVASIYGPDFDVILYGSYARGDAEPGSDVDLMYLVGRSQDEVRKRSPEVSDAAAELLFKYDVLVSPVVRSRAFFHQWKEAVPFYRNVENEGVRYYAR